MNAPGIDFIGATPVATFADRDIFAGADVSGANLAGLNVIGLPPDLTGTKLDGATLTNVNLSLATGRRYLADVSAAGASCRVPNLSAPTSLEPILSAPMFLARISPARGIDVVGGVTAAGAEFANAYLYGNGQALDDATNLHDINRKESTRDQPHYARRSVDRGRGVRAGHYRGGRGGRRGVGDRQSAHVHRDLIARAANLPLC